jgi:putative membrane protein
MADRSNDSGLRRFAAPALLILSAVVVFVAIFSLLGAEKHDGPTTSLGLEDGNGQTYDLTTLDRRTWIAAFSGTCAAALSDTALGDLSETDDATLPLLCFSLTDDAPGAADQPSIEQGGHAGVWTSLRGDVDVLARLATERFGFTPEDLESAKSGATSLVATVSPRGRTLGRYRVGPDGAADALDGVGADVDFVRSLERRPALHAALNATCGLLLLCGLFCIRRRRIGAHLGFMVSACLTTLLFLASYLYYHHHAGSTGFQGQGWARSLYFAILLTHTVLAAFLVPLVSTLLVHAIRRRFDRHRGLARWTFPIWLYVSVTGVLIYFMLYVWYAAP